MALPVDGSPSSSYKEVTVSLVGLRRLLLFIIVNMDEQSQNAHDQLTDQDQFRMSHHITTSPPKKRRLCQRSVASSKDNANEGTTRLSYTGSASAYPMRRSHYSTICRIWQARKEF